MKNLIEKHIMTFNKTTGDSMKTIALCKKAYLLMSSQSQPPPLSSPIIMHKQFRDLSLPPL